MSHDPARPAADAAAPPPVENPSRADLVVELSVNMLDRVDPATAQLAEQLRGAERRVAPRLAVNISAFCQIDGVPTEQAVGDLSVGGMMLHLTSETELGKRVRVLLALPYIGGQKLCSLAGVIRWLKPGGPPGAVCSAGVQFDTDVNPADLETLRGFLALWGMPRNADAARPA